MPVSIHRIAASLLAAFVLLAGALGYWAASGPALGARADNPRRILAEQRIRRGSILDRDGEVIVQSVEDGGAYARHSLYPGAAPFTGYYSINYGTSEIEQAFDGTLRGSLGVDPLQAQIDALLHVSPVGRAVQLTIDLDVQRLADARLASRTGAIVVMSVHDGDILALSSRPTFDPNTLEDDWDTLRIDPAAPLLNRATQGQYQPGTTLEPIVVIEALRRGIAALDGVPEMPARPYAIDSQALACRDAPARVVTLADALRAACPAPIADLGTALGSDALQDIAATWGLTGVEVVGLQSRAPFTDTIMLTDTRALQEFALGQSRLTVTPLQMAVVAQTLAARGEVRPPRIVSATQTIDRAWQPIEAARPRRVAPRETIERVIAALPRDGDSIWHAGIGLSGPTQLSWLIGFTPIDDPKYAVAVLIEQEQAAPDWAAIEIGRQLLSALP